MKKLSTITLIIFTLILASCSENYSNGERIGVITQFSKTGQWYKSWEGHLNLTQTGMNSSVPFDFSIDNDNEPAGLVATLDSAATHGWQVKLVYHEVNGGLNCAKNRGETNHFVTKCEVLERKFKPMFGGHDTTTVQGKTIDTIYFIPVPKEKMRELLK